jgi:hypothetical protein
VLVSLSAAFDRATIDDLLFLREIQRRQPQEFVMTGDGIGKYSQLFAAGLAEWSSLGGHRSGMSKVDYFEVRISRRGELLLAAWESGDEKALRKVTVRATATDGVRVSDSAIAVVVRGDGSTRSTK